VSRWIGRQPLTSCGARRQIVVQGAQLVRYLLLARQPETRLVDAFAVAIDRSADRRRGGSVVCRLRVSNRNDQGHPAGVP
jgi:hypothetical protein